ncbi:MAG: rRNA pseudouridine synthase [Anaerolineae bacterium]|nr:rRNA pseudouridine synthase [Anaerolineae bacterium]MDW8173025.1 pseudouridine synthase [Anaerolineae bacterium]
MKERLQKLMARADIGSRRACEELIAQRRVTLNGKIAQLGDQADPFEDEIRVDGQRIRPDDYLPRYYALNKPKNVLSTNDAPPGDDRPTVREYIPVHGHLFTIGRLDADSEGLIVLTNDGETANKLAHPRYEHTKTYKVWLYGHPPAEVFERWMDGVWLDDSRTAPCYIRIMESTPQQTLIRIVMLEGRKRQIRRIATTFGYPVARLVRTHIGQLGLGTLERGAWVQLTMDEVELMMRPAEEVRYIRRHRRIPRPPLVIPQGMKPTQPRLRLMNDDQAKQTPGRSHKRPNARKSALNRGTANKPSTNRRISKPSAKPKRES